MKKIAWIAIIYSIISLSLNLAMPIIFHWQYTIGLGRFDLEAYAPQIITIALEEMKLVRIVGGFWALVCLLLNMNWKITIEDLVLSFRESLISLLPTMDKVRISWKDHDAYDEWDEIAEVLYKNILVQALIDSDNNLTSINLPKYDILMSDYNSLDFISVSPKKIRPNEQLIFVGFSTKKMAFDHVKCLSLEKKYGDKIISYFPVKECNFSLQLHNGETITSLEFH